MTSEKLLAKIFYKQEEFSLIENVRFLLLISLGQWKLLTSIRIWNCLCKGQDQEPSLPPQGRCCWSVDQRDCGPAWGERAGRSDRWGTHSNLQLEGGVGALRSLKSERLVSLIMPQRGLQVVPQREVCAYDAICYLINDASHQEWTVCWMQIWYRKEVVPLSHGINSNLKEQHFKHC